MRFSLTIKLFLIVLLVFVGVLGSSQALANDKCECMVHDDEGCERSWGDEKCSELKECCNKDNNCCCPGTICEGPEGDKKCVGGLFTKGQSAECLAKGNCDRCDLLMIVKNVFQLLVQIAGALAVLSIVIAGVMYMLGGGALGALTTQAASPGVQKAKNALTAAIIGLLIVLFAWSMITWMMHFLGYTHPYGKAWYEIQCGEEIKACCYNPDDPSIHEEYSSWDVCIDKCKKDYGEGWQCYGGGCPPPEFEL